MTRTAARTRCGTALAGAALLLAGCATDSPSAGPADAAVASAAPAGEAVGRLRQFRSGISQRVVQVTVTARDPLHVTGLRLRAGGFAPPPSTALDVALPAGAVVDLPTGYGSALCGTPPGAAVATLTLQRADGTPDELELALPDGGLLSRLHDAECAEAALRRQVDLRVDEGWTEGERDGRPVLRGTLRLVRREPGHTVVLQELGGNILLTLRSDGRQPPLLVLGPDEQVGGLPLELTATRCDPHALAESKRTSLLDVYVGLDEASPRLTTIVPDPASRARIEAFAVAACRTP